MEGVDEGVGQEEVRAWLRAQGATEVQLRACGSDLSGVAADVALARDDQLSASDIAARLGVGVDRVIQVFRTYGIVVPDAEAERFCEDDASFVEVSAEAGIVDTTEGRTLTRVVGTALDGVADAAVALFVQSKELQLVRQGASPLTLAQETAHMTELAGRLGVGMGTLFRHHLRQAIARQRVTQAAVTSRDVVRIAVGFVDLVGSTAFGETADIGELRKLVTEFEARTFEVAAEQGGRVVKFIGDAIMVAALDPASGCRLMQALVEACCTGGLQPRGGLSFGEVLFHGGDYYGREVNLASRLVDEAIPGEILVDASVARADVEAPVGVDDNEGKVTFEPAGRRLLKGFTEPVAVWSVTSP
jgi:class 3 adenylate cyclase